MVYENCISFIDEQKKRESDGYVQTLYGAIELCVGPIIYNQLKNFFSPFYIFQENAPKLKPIARIFAAIRSSDPARAPSVNMDDYLGAFEAGEGLNGWEHYERPSIDVEMYFDRSDRQLIIIAPDATSLELQTRVILRDQFLQSIEWNEGVFMIHAAAAEKGGTVFAFTGTQGSGKTSSLLGLMSEEKCNFLTADRLKLAIEDNYIVARGVPARCNVHVVAFNSGEVLAPIAHLANTANIINGKILVPINDLTSLFGVKATSEGKLGILVLPSVCSEKDKPVCVEQVPPECLSDILKANRLGQLPSDRHQSWLRCFETNDIFDPLSRLGDVKNPPLILRAHGGISAYQKWLPELTRLVKR